MTLLTVRDWYREAKGQHYSLQLLIEFLIYEKAVLKMDSSTEELTYYLQDRYAKAMNEHLKDYEVKRNVS